MNWVNEDDECKTALHQSILGVCKLGSCSIRISCFRLVGLLIFFLFCLVVGRGGLMVSVLNSGANGRVWVLAGNIVLCSWARHCSHGAFLHPGV